MRKHKIMFLFGAGASHGNCDDSNPTPPLGNKLYPELIKSSYLWHYYNQSHFNDEIREEFKKNFELAFTKIYDLFRPQVILQLQVGMMEYLNQFAPHPDLKENNYYKLINSLKEKSLLRHSVFSSLNYDCIFEKLLNNCKIPYCDYLGNRDESYGEDLKLFKPHGSSNYAVRQSNFDAQNV
jgi:hypothetical protein